MTSMISGVRQSPSSSSIELVEPIRKNVETARISFAERDPPGIMGTVAGTGAACAFWQSRLEKVRADLRCKQAVSFHEDLPVGQAFGLLLLWQRLRPLFASGEGALVAFVFGSGKRATPFTEAECGQKPAMETFVPGESDPSRYLSIVELALRHFSPVESHLRRSGFDGVVIKWGDEVQIPTADLSRTNPLFAEADVIRFVSMKRITDEDARSKDWVGVDESGGITAFIPRRPIEEMLPLAERGLLGWREGELIGGINLGSIAISRVLLDVLLEEFEEEVNDPSAAREDRPDLDPQLFTALTIARIDDPKEREEARSRALSESEAVRALFRRMPDVIERLRRALGSFEKKHGRKIRMVAMDFGDQYWGDLGQHRQIHDFFMALAEDGPNGEIARSLAGLDFRRDEHGNFIAKDTVLGQGVRASGSVLIDARIDSGNISSSVLIGTRAGELRARSAFDVRSTVTRLSLAPRAGTYKVVSTGPVALCAGERACSVFLPERELLLKVREDMDLRDEAPSYDVPVLGNEMSFREAHELTSLSDPMVAGARREARRAEVERLLGSPLQR